MTADQIERMRSLFTQAQDYPPDQREAFLNQACPDDVDLRREVVALLRCEEEASDFLEEPAFERGLDLIQRTAAGRLRSGDTVGDCRVVSLLGVGGMGEVYLTEDAVHGRQVALKLIGQGRAEDVRGRHFRHERKVLAALNHPHIARLYDSGVTDQGQAYLVMEYVEGERLDHFWRARDLNVNERLALFRKVCAAVSYAHQNLVVHRDLKPANIRVTPEGEPKLLDFGIAKLLEPEGDAGAAAAPTLTLQGVMTPEYASPEQIKGETITTASDVYSLGVVLYELLAGQRPFAHLKGRRPDEFARAVCEEEPPRPSTVAARTTSSPGTPARSAEPAPATARTGAATLRRQLEGDLDNIVVKALQKDPARRYASVTAFSEDLRRHGVGLPVSARRDTAGYRAGKFVRRHKVSVAATVLAVLALLIGMAATVWQARAARQERDRAQQERDRAGLAQRQAERLNAFLQTLLASADASHAGKDQKVSEVLDVASRNLDRDLAEEPEVLVQAHEALYRSYSQLGLFAPAEEHARAALDLVRRLHGADDLATARAEVMLTDVMTERYEWNEVELMLHHAIGVLRRQAAPDRAELAVALNSLGFYLINQEGNRTDEAERCMIEALDHAKAVWGEQSPHYAQYLSGLGNVKAAQRDLAASETIYRRALALQEQFAPGGERSSTLMLNLSLIFFEQDRRDEAKQMLDRLDGNARRMFGEKSYYVTYCAYAYGVLDATAGDYLAAIPRLQQALLALTADYSPDYMTVVQSRAMLGLCLTRTGRAAEAEEMLRAALANSTAIDRGDFDHTCGNPESALGECLLAQKHYSEAEPLLLTGHTDLEKRLGPQNKLTAQARRCLHDLYLAWNRPEEAKRYEVNITAQTTPAP